MRVILCLLLLLVGATAAQPLTCTVPKRAVALRKGGTVLLDAEVTNHTSSLFEGRLQATILRGGRKSSTHAGPELVIPPGALKTQLLLPPPLDPAYGEGFAVQLAFVDRSGVIPLGDHAMGRFPDGPEEFILAIARTSRRLSELDRARERSARLERFRPVLETSAWFGTATLSVQIENLPVHPAGWCAYDVVLSDAAAFNDLTARHLDALARWIEAGGSALIFADGAVRERQLAFLRRLAGSGQSIRVDAEERIEPRENLRLAAGLGRVLVAAAPPSTPTETDAGEWRAAVAWLWRARPELLGHIRDTGVWPTTRDNSQDYWARSQPQQLAHWAREFATGVDREAIERPRPLPIGWVVLLLGSLLILAGPGDWYMLGWLRRRRWTWVVFPAVCLAFAWVASRLASQYLGQKSRHTVVRVIDLGEDGQVLREVVLELRVPSNDEEWTTETTDGFSVAMPSATMQDLAGRFEAAGEFPETRAEWLSHSRVMLRQNTRQWTPNWRQTVSFTRAAKPEGPDWQALIEQWKQTAANGDVPLPSRAGDFGVFFLSRRIHDFPASGQVMAADSPITADIAVLLGKDGAALPDLLEHRSPVMTASDMLGASPRERVAILAWRRNSDGLEVLRRHVSARELNAAP